MFDCGPEHSAKDEKTSTLGMGTAGPHGQSMFVRLRDIVYIEKGDSEEVESVRVDMEKLSLGSSELYILLM
jgi:hypothetical protein